MPLARNPEYSIFAFAEELSLGVQDVNKRFLGKPTSYYLICDKARYHLHACWHTCCLRSICFFVVTMRML